MARSLVIVESPAKARTINRYLGKDYIVKSSVGHIRDLPTGGKASDPKARAKEAAKTRKLSAKAKDAYRKKRARAQLVKRMGVDPEHKWKATYEILPGKEKVVEELRKLAEKSDQIFLATDLDREGEAIAWHLKETIGGDPDRYHRVVFNEITRKAIQDAFAKPTTIDTSRVSAQQARRFLDRVVGFELSPLLWAKVARGLSAGRVQSVAVRLIVEREREIRAFVPEEYWEAFADLTRRGDAGRGDAGRGDAGRGDAGRGDAGRGDARRGDAEEYRFQVVKDRGENYRPGSAEQSDAAMARLRGQPVSVRSREDRATTTRPNPPFITSTLQQAASTRLSFSVKKTMTMAQRLYEAGYITYMRTDSTNLSADAIGDCRDFIQKNFGAAYLPEQPNTYASKAAAQEAHEAIRPSNVSTAPTALVGMEDDAVRLYEMIWRQFVACQMPPAQYTSTTVIAQAGEFELRIRGRILRFDGFTRVLPAVVRKDEDRTLPDFVADEPLDVARLEALQHFTKPSPRYGEASLVRELETRGIGRPSTYAAIISTIQERGYVTLTARRFHAEKIGELVTDRLVENFDNLLDFGFTAQLEEELDQIAEGTADWRAVLDTFYGDFTGKLHRAQAERGGMRPNVPTDTDIVCSVCGRTMQIRTGSTGVFLGCSGYALPPKERCTHTLNLIPGDEVVDVDADSEGESRLLRSKRRCPRCDTLMHSYLVDEGRKLHVCSNNPDCPGYLVEQGEFRIKGYDGPVIECDKCRADMQLKSGRFGKYFGCSNSNCKNTRKLLRNGEAAPPKAAPVPMPELRCVKVDDHYVLRDGASGIFLAASQFPKHRETRAPTVAELVPHRAEIDPKHHYLLDAPRTDPDRNPAIVKFSRKSREQFVASEANGVATGWRALYRSGKWVEENGSAAPAKATPRRSAKRAAQ